ETESVRACALQQRFQITAAASAQLDAMHHARGRHGGCRPRENDDNAVELEVLLGSRDRDARQPVPARLVHAPLQLAWTCMDDAVLQTSGLSLDAWRNGGA